MKLNKKIESIKCRIRSIESVGLHTSNISLDNEEPTFWTYNGIIERLNLKVGDKIKVTRELIK